MNFFSCFMNRCVPYSIQWIMKRLIPFATLLLLAALLLSPATAISGARQGLDIWWGRVLPALLPSFISIRLVQNMGLLKISTDRPRTQLALAIGFSLISGAPNGAKLLSALVEDGTLSRQEADRLLPLVNAVSPVFLLSIIALELLKNEALFLPMAVAYYGCVLCGVLLQTGQGSRPLSPVYPAGVEPPSFPSALSSAMESSMLDMLRICGCIIFTCTLLSLTRPLLSSEGAYAALASCMEVSTGTAMVSGLSLPLRLKSSLLIGVSAFGGLSLALQTMCCYPELKLGPYLLKKLLLGALVGLICYLLFPLFPSVSAVFASRQQMLSRSLTLSALLLSSALSLAFIGVLSLMMDQRKKG